MQRAALDVLLPSILNDGGHEGPLLADSRPLRQADVGQKQPLGYLCKSRALHSTKKSSRVEICVYTFTVQKSGLALGLWCICHTALLKLEHRFCLPSITQKPYF